MCQARKLMGFDSSLFHSSDCMSKAFSIRPDGMGQYTCDECGKIFKHPGNESLPRVSYYETVEKDIESDSSLGDL